MGFQQVIILLGQLLSKYLPSLTKLLTKAPLWLAGIAIAVSTFIAAGVLSQAAIDLFAGFASSSPQTWCIATAFGVDLGLYWFVEGMVVTVGVMVFLTLKRPILEATSEFQWGML